MTSKATTPAKAAAQARLLRAVAFSKWRPTYRRKGDVRLRPAMRKAQQPQRKLWRTFTSASEARRAARTYLVARPGSKVALADLGRGAGRRYAMYVKSK